MDKIFKFWGQVWLDFTLPIMQQVVLFGFHFMINSNFVSFSYHPKLSLLRVCIFEALAVVTLMMSSGSNVVNLTKLSGLFWQTCAEPWKTSCNFFFFTLAEQHSWNVRFSEDRKQLKLNKCLSSESNKFLWFYGYLKTILKLSTLDRLLTSLFTIKWKEKS